MINFDIEDLKKQITPIAESHNLLLVVIHGSFVTGKNKIGSDLDIAILGKKLIQFDELLEIHGDFAKIFGDNRERELDLKSLHDVNPLFRFEVMRDSVLLYGKTADYYAFKAYAFRDFQESKSLFGLLDKLIHKRQKYFMENYTTRHVR
ncbi:MAG: nucleotidyltransferase domain-containing protein [Patescibacteria group bacterium]